MKKLKDYIVLLLLLFGLTIVGLTFTCPFIISVYTGNWWYMLLFIVTWIPTLFEIFIIQFIISITE